MEIKKEDLIAQIEQLPPEAVRAVYDFIQRIKAGEIPPGIESYLLSESALSKSWNSPEDEAWNDQ